MRDQFPGFYRPSREQFDEMWSKASFVLDANVLLNLYRYSANTSRQLLDVLQAVSDRLWVPHQAAHEFLRNRLAVIQQRADMYADLVNEVEKAFRVLTDAANRLKRHPELEEGVVQQHADAMYAALNQYIDGQRSKATDLLADDALDDPILAEVTKLLEGRVGEALTEEELEALYERGRQRFDAKQPPGYEDARSKDEPERYGDLVLWEEILRHAESAGRPIVFITDEDKADWWWKHRGETIAPRRELVEEARKRAGVLFYMYRPPRFMDEARTLLSSSVVVEADAIEEAGSIDPWQLASDDDNHESSTVVRAGSRVRPDRTGDGWRGPEACKLVGVTYRQLDYWARTDLLRPSLADAKGAGTQRRYSYRDLLELKVIKRLLDAGMSLQSVRRAVSHLREALGSDVATTSLVVDQTRNTPFIAESSDEMVELLRGSQGVLNIVPLAGVKEELDAAIERLAGGSANGD